MNRRELLTGAALLSGVAQANAFGFGKQGALFGSQGASHLGGASGPSLYLGQVATRTFVPNAINSAGRQQYSRTLHYARDDITSLQIDLPNFYVPNVAAPNMQETGPGSVGTFTASVEYPIGVSVGIFLFSGSATGSASNKSLLTSDALSITIPIGAQFAIRVWNACSTGTIQSAYATTGGAYTGDNYTVSATTVPDLTNSLTLTTQATNTIGPAPAALIAQTRKASVAIIGDSRAFGFRDTADSSLDMGEIARSIGPTLAYINMGVPSDNAVSYTNGSQSALRRILAGYCSHRILQLGINDVAGSASAATILAAYQAIAGYAATPIRQATLAPETTSTDAWFTVANQTPYANESVRVSVNTSIRAGLANFGTYLEVANQVENSQNGGKWKLNPGGGGSQMTTDGIHERSVANLIIQASGAIDPASFTR